MQRHSIKKLGLLACLLGHASFMYWLISAANTKAANGLISFAAGIPYGDKIGHFIVMGMMALLVNLLLSSRRQSIGKREFLLGSLIVAGIVTTEEFAQIFIPTRTFSLFDLAADYAGIAIFGRLAAVLSRQRLRYLILTVQYFARKTWIRGAERFRLTFSGRQA